MQRNRPAPPAPRHRGIGKIAFLARRDAIAGALDRGYTLRMLHDEHGAALGISYSQFARYVARYLRPAPHAATPPPASAPAPSAASGPPAAPRPGPSSAPPEIRTFRYDPLANRREDLV